jgi:hypothetical protein
MKPAELCIWLYMTAHDYARARAADTARLIEIRIEPVQSPPNSLSISSADLDGPLALRMPDALAAFPAFNLP